MAGEFTTSNYTDLLNATQEAIVERGKVINLMTDLESYPLVATFAPGGKWHKTVPAGKSHKFPLVTDDNGTFEAAGMFDQATPRISTAMTNAEVPMRYVRGHCVYSMISEAMQSNDATVIADIVEIEMQRMYQSILDGLEHALASKPATSADVKTVWGLPMYFVTGTTEGFTGLNPTGFSSGVAGVDSTTYARWANWWSSFTNYSRADFGVTFDRAILSTKFLSPIKVNMPDAAPSEPMRKWFTTKENIIALKTYQESRNTNLGPDVVVNSLGEVSINGNPVVHASVLDSDTSNPFYGVDGNTMKMISHSGLDEIRPSDAYKADGYYSDTQMSDALFSCNLSCMDRRRQILIHGPASS